MSDTLVTVWFQVPTCDDATRVAHGPRFWRTLETAMLAQWGGFTRTGTVRGAWRDGGRTVRDTSRTFETDMPEASLPGARLFLAGVCARAGQKCLRVKIRGEAQYLAPDAKGWPA